MADTEDRGLTALEAVEQYCKMWTWAGTASDDPAERTEKLKDAARQLTSMLRHEVAKEEVAPAPMRWRTIDHRTWAERLIERAKRRGIEVSPGAAVGRAQRTRIYPGDHYGPQPVHLWATGHKGSAINTPSESFSPEQWADLTLDIEDNSALDGDVRYVAVRIFDHEPALAADGAKDDESLAPEDVGDATDEIPQPSTGTPGRPSRKADILDAYQSLKDGDKINFSAPMTRLYKKIRMKIVGVEGNKKGLRDEAIRKVVTKLFEADKKESFDKEASKGEHNTSP